MTKNDIVKLGGKIGLYISAKTSARMSLWDLLAMSGKRRKEIFIRCAIYKMSQWYLRKDIAKDVSLRSLDDIRETSQSDIFPLRQIKISGWYLRKDIGKDVSFRSFDDVWKTSQSDLFPVCQIQDISIISGKRLPQRDLIKITKRCFGNVIKGYFASYQISLRDIWWRLMISLKWYFAVWKIIRRLKMISE